LHSKKGECKKCKVEGRVAGFALRALNLNAFLQR